MSSVVNTSLFTIIINTFPPLEDQFRQTKKYILARFHTKHNFLLLLVGVARTRVYVIRNIFLFCGVMMGCAKAQQNSIPYYCFELHGALQGSFGPSESQAEIVGGIDSITYDKKKHFSPGFKTSNVAEFAAGYYKNNFSLQSTTSYFVKDIGLVQKISSNEYPFILANILSLKISALLHWSNKENPKPYGFFTGLFISSVFPVSYKIKNQAKLDFSIKDFRPSSQLCWGMDFNYSIKISDKGWYAIAGMNGTMPGLIGRIGKIEMQSNAPYNVIKDKIQMYSYSAFLGIGKCLQK